MLSIFSRSMRRGNALERLTSAVLFAWTLSVAGCAVPPSTPANIILNDPHSNGDSLAFSRDSTQLAAGDNEGLIWLWQTPHAKALVHWQAHNGPVQGLAHIHKSIDYSADGKTVASISRQTDSAVYFLDPATGAVQRRFQPHDLCGVRVRLSPNGRYLASTADDASVRLWDLHNPLPDQTTYLQDTDKVLR